MIIKAACAKSAAKLQLWCCLYNRAASFIKQNRLKLYCFDGFKGVWIAALVWDIRCFKPTKRRLEDQTKPPAIHRSNSSWFEPFSLKHRYSLMSCWVCVFTWFPYNRLFGFWKSLFFVFWWRLDIDRVLVINPVFVKACVSEFLTVAEWGWAEGHCPGTETGRGACRSGACVCLSRRSRW